MLILLSTLLLLQAGTSAGRASKQFNNGLLLDCGSTGTRLKIFQWSRESPMSKVQIDQIGEEKFAALTDFIGRVDDLAEFVEDVIDQAKTYIVRDRQDCPIYFMATAGMRGVPVVDADAIFNKIEEVLSDPNKNPFSYQPGYVRVISGEEEGVFAWVALNYHRGAFWSTRPIEATGVIEMGGGSTQIVFQPDTSVLENAYSVRIGGQTYLLYVHSYLFYGLNYLLQRTSSYLAYHNTTQQTVENPCLLKGDTSTITDTNNNLRNVTGTSDPGECRALIDIFLRGPSDASSGIDWCHPKPCAIGHVYQTPVGDKDFYALSGFVYGPNTLNAVGDNNVLDVALLEANAEEYCSGNLSAAVNDWGASSRYATNDCVTGLYMPKLLKEAYGFTANNTVYVTSEVDGKDIDWTTGAMLLEIEENSQLSDLDTSTGVILTTNYVILLTMFVFGQLM